MIIKAILNLHKKEKNAQTVCANKTIHAFLCLSKENNTLNWGSKVRILYT